MKDDRFYATALIFCGIGAILVGIYFLYVKELYGYIFIGLGLVLIINVIVQLRDYLKQDKTSKTWRSYK